MSADPWTPWERYHIEGLAPVARVEILDVFAREIEERAKRLGMRPATVLNAIIAAGLAIFSTERRP